MDNQARDIRSSRNPKSRVKVTEGHFATVHSHINLHIDMSIVKHQHNNARETAKLLAERYRTSRTVDTLVCLEGMELIAAYIAEDLADPSSMISINSGKNISVITPEYNHTGQMVFGTNVQRMVRHMQVLLLSASITTGKTIGRAVEGIRYYEGAVCGIASIFSAVNTICGMTVDSIFCASDLPAYEIYNPNACPYCKKGIKVDALINSFGDSLPE